MNIVAMCLRSFFTIGILFALIGCGGGESPDASENTILMEGNLDSRIGLARTPGEVEWAAAAERAATTAIVLQGTDGASFDVVLRFSFKSQDIWLVRATVSDCDNSSELELRFEPNGVRDTAHAAKLPILDCAGRLPEAITLDLTGFSQFGAPFQITGLERKS